MNLHEVLLHRKYEYVRIFSGIKNLLILDSQPALIDVIIAVRNRGQYLRSTLQYLSRAAARVKDSINFLVVETDVSPKHADLLSDLGTDYIFLHQDYTDADGLFPKSFAYNLGFLFSPGSEYVLFHDADILVEEDFFWIIVSQYLQHLSTWLQPFSGRKVHLLDEDKTNKIMADKEFADLSAIESLPVKNGAPGGSILVPSNLVKRVGGHDPELFYGYSGEDSFFWTKLECIFKQLDRIDNCHQGSALYADKPPLNVYHLFHEPQQHTNPFYFQMMAAHDRFWKASYRDKMSYIDMKATLFEDERDKIKAYAKSKNIHL